MSVATRTCPVCGRRASGFYCTVECRVLARNLARNPDSAPPYLRVCVVCGGAFSTRNKRKRICDADCRREVARRRREGPEAEMAAIVSLDPCCYCGARRQYWRDEPGIGADHIVPVVAGGELGETNLTGACMWCNCSKGTTSLLLFLLGVPT